MLCSWSARSGYRCGDAVTATQLGVYIIMIYLSFNIPPVRKYYVYYTNTVNESMFSPQNESTVQENILQRKEKKITHTFL